MAATLNVTAGAASLEATISGSCLSDQFDRLIDITADVLLHPSFPDEELARYKQRTRAQLMQQRANPGFLAAEMFSRGIYGTHPAARVSPTVAALDKTTRDALMTFHRAHYAPDHAGIAIAGDISMAEARKLIDTKLAGWSKAGVPPAAVSEPAALTGPKIYFIARPNSVQTNLIVGTQAIARTHADYDVLQVMNKVIGGGPTGRLFIHLREEKGYTYGASSSLSAPMYRGDWSASTSVRSEVTEPALHDLLAEVTWLPQVPVSRRGVDRPDTMDERFPLPCSRSRGTRSTTPLHRGGAALRVPGGNCRRRACGGCRRTRRNGGRGGPRGRSAAQLAADYGGLAAPRGSPGRFDHWGRWQTSPPVTGASRRSGTLQRD